MGVNQLLNPGGLTDDGKYLTNDALDAMGLDTNIYKNVTPDMAVGISTLQNNQIGSNWFDKYLGEDTAMGKMLAPNGTSGISKLGSLAGAAGSLAGIWGAYEGVKAAKDANKLKKEQYEYLKSRDAKSDAYKSGLASTFANAYQGPSYNKYTPTAPAAAPIKL